ncbi:MAG: putative DNA binding domain-containing protein [Verrucomicrobiales bacterium]|nr:putative DNA binding domain-containing protein [Verrucomicrobiales bacterium]
MMRYSDAELEKLLNETESDLAERKETWQGDAPDKGRQAVCAFANDLPDHGRPGVLFVGAKDDGSPSRLSITDDLLRTLADIKTDGQILPPPTLLVEKRILEGTEMAVVTVQPADAPPVRYRGRIWIRLGPRRGIATAQDERILNEKRRHRDLPFDLQPIPSSAVTDLNRRLFEEDYLPAAFAPDILAANDRSYEERLAACRMIAAADQPTPTMLGMLVLGVRPEDYIGGDYIQFLRIGGSKLSDPILDSKRVSGPLASLLRELDVVLAAYVQTRVDPTAGPVEKRASNYPLPALQQLVRNAVMHRTYEATNAPVRITWFNDRVEILSPGGPFGRVTIENFGQPGVVDYRNRNLAEAMRVLGFVQRFGVGLAIARQQLTNNGNPPLELLPAQNHVLVTLRPAP